MEDPKHKGIELDPIYEAPIPPKLIGYVSRIDGIVYDAEGNESMPVGEAPSVDQPPSEESPRRSRR